MNLEAFLKTMTLKERAVFAERCDTSSGHLHNIAYGCKPCREALAIKIERESAGRVIVEELRPDVDWAVIRGKCKKRTVTRPSN
jgi:DNA-binding transcriptional regulator YdaS (Cro superfamily)